jgi:hypothetical protein
MAAAATAVVVEALAASGRVDDAAREARSLPNDDPGGVSGLLVLRARAVLGDERAATESRQLSAALAMPGLASV